MIIESPGEVAFYIFNLPVYWYGIVMAFAVFSGVFTSEVLVRKFNCDIPNDFFIDNSPILILFGILGARLYYCLLNFSYYSTNFLEIFDIRQGGLSIHGMMFVGVVLIYFLAKKSNIKFLNLLDVLAVSVPFAQSIGRWGNFFNSEAYGVPTNSNWGLFIPLSKRPDGFEQYQLFHPTFLYESVLDFVIFVVLLVFFIKRPKNGSVFFLYLILYSVVRFLIEHVRIDSALNVFGVPFAQIVSLILFVCGIVSLLWLRKKSY